MKIEGKPILEHIVNFLKFSKKTDQIIVATSNLKSDDKIEKLCNKINVSCFRGDSLNVLKRYFDCATKYQCDIVVRITADNPLIDPILVDKAIRLLINKKFDYVSNMIHPTYPEGYLVEVFTFNTLKYVYETFHDDLSKEHVTFQLRKSPKELKIGEFFATKTKQRPDYRLTVDYKDDLKLIKKIFSTLYKPNSFISYTSVFNYLKQHPSTLKINHKYSIKS
jgi:spore coat polysaccharide biosynthesis protein SpsF (cytidylyltransferase family)